MSGKEIKEIKEKYGTRHGFVFSSDKEASKNSIQNLKDMIKRCGVCEDPNEEPEVVLKSGTDYFFIYKESSTFPTGAFYQASQLLCKLIEFQLNTKVQIDTIANFLKDD